MLNHVHKFIIVCGLVLSVHSWAGGSDFAKTIGGLQCPKSFKAWKDEVNGMKSASVEFVKSLSAEQAEAKIGFKERDIMFVTLVWPGQLDSAIKYSAMYQDCADLHWKFLGNAKKESFDEWKTCVEHGYGRDTLPEVFTFLAGCYEKLL